MQAGVQESVVCVRLCGLVTVKATQGRGGVKGALKLDLGACMSSAWSVASQPRACCFEPLPC